MKKYYNPKLVNFLNRIYRWNRLEDIKDLKHEIEQFFYDFLNESNVK